MNRPVPPNASRHKRGPTCGADPQRETDGSRGHRDELKPVTLGCIGVAITAADKKVLHANDQLCEMLGYNANELRALSWPEFTYSPDLPQDLYHFHRMCAGEIDKYSLPKRFIRKQGDLIETVISVTCVRRADGVIDSVVGLVEATRARQQPVRSLQEFLKQLPSGLSSAQQALSVVGSDQAAEPPHHIAAHVRTDRPQTGQLTDREVDVLILLAEGLSHKDVAAKLAISVRTVDAHTRNIMRKLDLHNTTDLLRFALRNQFISA